MKRHRQRKCESESRIHVWHRKMSAGSSGIYGGRWRTNQRKAACKDHGDDKRLEVLMLNESERIASYTPESLSCRRCSQRIHPPPDCHSTPRTTVIRVLEENFVHFVHFRSVEKPCCSATRRNASVFTGSFLFVVVFFFV